MCHIEQHCLFNRQNIRHYNEQLAYDSSFFFLDANGVSLHSASRWRGHARCVVSCRRVCRWNLTETERAGDRVFTLMDMLSMKIKRAEWPPRRGRVEELNEEWKDAHIDTVSLIIWFGSRELNYTGFYLWKQGRSKKQSSGAKAEWRTLSLKSHVFILSLFIMAYHYGNGGLY